MGWYNPSTLNPRSAKPPMPETVSPPLGFAAREPLLYGGLLAALSALWFGLVTPLVQRFGHHAGAFTTAGLLYGGAALVSLIPAQRGGKDAPLQRVHLPRLFGVALLGAVVAPVCLAWGLQRTSATVASLTLNTEALFTVLLARIVFHEPVGKRVAFAVAAMLLGGVLLGFGTGVSAAGSGWGTLAVVVASLAWAADNTLTRPLADFDGRHVVLIKAATGSVLSLSLARAFHEVAPPWPQASALVACGAFGYGLSLRLYLMAQRRIGAGRTGSIFALAPFIGAGAALAMGDSAGGWPTLGAAALFLLGIYLHLTERHRHRHEHTELDHEHGHRHDDGHHEHVHSPPFLGEHSHPHHHDAAVHNHPHAPDLHHQHSHH